MGSRARPKQEEDVSVQGPAALPDQHDCVMGSYQQSVQRLALSPHPQDLKQPFQTPFQTPHLPRPLLPSNQHPPPLELVSIDPASLTPQLPSR